VIYSDIYFIIKIEDILWTSVLSNFDMAEFLLDSLTLLLLRVAFENSQSHLSSIDI
jgi:hypothetical protein